MKICLIGVFPENVQQVKGGVANVILYLAQGLVLKGHEVHVVTTGVSNNSLVYPTGIHVHVVKVPALLPRLLTNWSVIAAAIQRTLLIIRPDISHFHGSATYLRGYQGCCLLTLHGIAELDAKYDKVLVPYFKSRAQAFIEGYFRKRVGNVIIINKYLLEAIGEDIKGNVSLIENPVSPMFYSVTPAPRLKIVTPGMISNRKNVLGLLEAFNIVHSTFPLAELRIIGPIRDVRYYNQCASFVAAHGLSDAVSFLGPLSPTAVSLELASASCMVLLSFQETAPLIIGEAMASGVPVVVSNAGGARYMVEEGVTGYVVDASNTQRAAERIIELVRDKEKAAAMGLAGRVAALKRFHLDRIIEQTLNVYERVVGGR